MSTSVSLPVYEGCTACPTRGAYCSGCPREEATSPLEGHYVEARLTSTSDVIIITESPIYPKMVSVNLMHRPMADDAGAIIRAAVADADKAFNTRLNVGFTHLVLCSGADPKKDVIDHCKNYLIEDIRDYTDAAHPPVLFCMGVSAAKALGMKVGSLKDMQSRILPNAVEIAGVKYTVVISISAKMLASMADLYQTFYTDLQHAWRVAAGAQFTQESIESLTKDYRYPKTLDDVRILCDEILAYTEGTTLPENWAIAVDTETNTLFAHLDKLKVLGVSFAWTTGKAAFIPLFHSETPYDGEKALFHVNRVLQSTKPKIFHNGKYDLKVFRKIKSVVTNYAWDTMTGEHVRYEGKTGQYGLKPLTRSRFPQFAAYADALHAIQVKAEGGDNQIDAIRSTQMVDTHADIFGKGKAKKAKKEGGFENIPLKDLELYGAVDADVTRRHSVRQSQELATEQYALTDRRIMAAKQPQRHVPMPVFAPGPAPLRALMREYVLPATRVLSKMEYNGVKIDRKAVVNMATTLSTQIVDTKKEILALTGRADLNLNAKADVVDVLFNTGYRDPETLRWILHPTTDVPKTKTGQLQTTAKVLSWLAANNGCPFSAKKLIYAKATKAKDTFLKSAYELSSLDGYIHTNFNQHGTCTGRLSSNALNLQNIPKELLHIKIKDIFVPDDDSYVFVNCDAKNAEIRILAAYCGDKALIKSILDGLDTHCFISEKIVQAIRAEGAAAAAAKLKTLNLDDQYPLTYQDFKDREKYDKTNHAYYEMMDKFRTAVKRVVFGILYGAGAKKIAETIGIKLEQAQALIDMLFTLFPAIKGYIDNTKAHLSEFGCVETFFGRRRRFDIRGATGAMRSRAQRQAVNFMIQSTSSDIVMGCLASIDTPLERDLGGRQLLTVHDSLAMQVPKKNLGQLADFLKQHLETRTTQLYPWMPVPFKWDFEVGKSYGSLSKLSTYLAAEKEAEAIRVRNEAAEAYSEGDVREILSIV